jgi:hypothetical protein
MFYSTRSFPEERAFFVTPSASTSTAHRTPGN